MSVTIYRAPQTWYAVCASRSAPGSAEHNGSKYVVRNAPFGLILRPSSRGSEHPSPYMQCASCKVKFNFRIEQLNSLV